MAITDIQLMFDLDHIGAEAEYLAPSWNVAPTRDVAIVVERIAESSSGVSRELHLARWGLIPSWAKSPAGSAPLINARVETAAEKPSFKESLAKRRCLIPANGYFEWKNEGGTKTPFYISSETPLAFAGLYSWWKAPDARWILSAAILTRAATAPLDTIHARTPIVLEPSEYEAWLDPHAQDPYAALALIERPNRELSAFPVATGVGNARFDDPSTIVPVGPPLGS